MIALIVNIYIMAIKYTNKCNFKHCICEEGFDLILAFRKSFADQGEIYFGNMFFFAIRSYLVTDVQHLNAQPSLQMHF